MATKPANTAAHWLKLADQYDREASTVPDCRPSHKEYWQRRAADARNKAASFNPTPDPHSPPAAWT